MLVVDGGRCRATINNQSLSVTLQHSEGIVGTTEVCPSFGCAPVGAVHDGRVGTAFDEELETVESRVLCREVHGNRGNTMTGTTKIMLQIGVGAMVEQPGRGFDLVRGLC